MGTVIGPVRPEGVVGLRNRVARLAALLFGLTAGTVALRGWGAVPPVVLGALVVGVLLVAVERSRERERS